MSIVVDLSYGAFRVEFNGVGRDFRGARAAEWVRDFVSGVSGDPKLAERVWCTDGTGEREGVDGVLRQGAGATCNVGDFEVRACGGAGGETCHFTGGRSGSATDSGEVGRGSHLVGLGLPCGPARGKNYARNQATRMKKRLKAQEVKFREQQGSGFFVGCDSAVQDELRESRAKLLVLENKRRAIEEERRIAKLESPMQVVEDAMAMVKFAAGAAKLSADSRVAGWAATLGEAESELLAKSAPSTIPSLSSVSAGSATEKRKSSGSKFLEKERVKALAKEKKKWTVVDNPMSKLEQEVIAIGIMSVGTLETARQKAGRKLSIEDFMNPKCPYPLSVSERFRLREASGERIQY